MNVLTLTPGSLSLKQLRHVWRQPVTLALDESAHRAINDSVACVEAIVAEGRTAYGINTGFWPAGTDPHCHARSGEFTTFAGVVARGGGWPAAGR
ncbi:histidine ammonia-lyase [Enterobacter hormaechei]|nr:histidine ammonia-lyase [Enterobacter hormaechei]